MVRKKSEMRFWYKVLTFLHLGFILFVFKNSALASTSINERVKNVRKEIKKQINSKELNPLDKNTPFLFEKRTDDPQWGNWPNWGNWDNWNNWGNWGNWRNY